MNREAIAQLTFEDESDNFALDWIFCKLTYPVGHRRFARNPIKGKSSNLYRKGVAQ
jgi:hypothetical protein